MTEAKLNYRDLVKRRLEEIDMSAHYLAKLLHGRVNRNHLYKWLRGECGLSADRIAWILHGVGLSVRLVPCKPPHELPPAPKDHRPRKLEFPV